MISGGCVGSNSCHVTASLWPRLTKDPHGSLAGCQLIGVARRKRAEKCLFPTKWKQAQRRSTTPQWSDKYLFVKVNAPATQKQQQHNNNSNNTDKRDGVELYLPTEIYATLPFTRRIERTLLLLGLNVFLVFDKTIHYKGIRMHSKL